MEIQLQPRSLDLQGGRTWVARLESEIVEEECHMVLGFRSGKRQGKGFELVVSAEVGMQMQAEFEGKGETEVGGLLFRGFLRVLGLVQLFWESFCNQKSKVNVDCADVHVDFEDFGSCTALVLVETELMNFYYLGAFVLIRG